VTLADAYPDDLWGRRARERTLREAVAVDPALVPAVKRREMARQAAYKRAGRVRRWRCSCLTLNAQARTWCGECGEDRA
jgi:hypothetical protein